MMWNLCKIWNTRRAIQSQGSKWSFKIPVLKYFISQEARTTEHFQKVLIFHFTLLHFHFNILLQKCVHFYEAKNMACWRRILDIVATNLFPWFCVYVVHNCGQVCPLILGQLWQYFCYFFISIISLTKINIYKAFLSHYVKDEPLKTC